MAVSVRAFLIDNGLLAPDQTPSHSGEFKIECVNCHNPKNKLYINAAGRGCNCKHCGLRESWRVFQRRYEPPTPQELALEKFVAEGQKELARRPDALKYLKDRGFEDDTITALRFGYCPSYAASPVDTEIGLADSSGRWVLGGYLLIPYLDKDVIYNIRGRVDPAIGEAEGRPKYRGLAGSEKHPYVPIQVDPDAPVVIAEGEFDAALLAQNGLQAIGVPGAGTCDSQWFRGIKELYVAFDSDDAGREGRASLLRHLAEVRVVDLPEAMDCTDYINNFGFAFFEELLKKADLYVHGRRQKDDRLTSTVDEFSSWAFANDALLGPRMKWAPRLEKVLSGWSPGLHLIGASANAGKTCLLCKAAYQAAVDNPDDTISVYLSLDDTMEEALSRMVSLHAQTHFETVRSPRIRLAGEPIAMRELIASFDSLKEVKNLIVRDATYGRSIKYIQSYIEHLRSKYPEKRLVVFLDSLAKITPDFDRAPDADPQASTGKTNWKSFLASELKYLTTLHRVCIVTPTDLRKLNDDRRPTRDDLKDAAELAYEANSILLCYNDVNQRRDRATLTWSYGTSETHPLFEVIVDKNKITSNKPVIRYRFYGPFSDFDELTEAEDEHWNRTIREEQEKKREAAALTR